MALKYMGKGIYVNNEGDKYIKRGRKFIQMSDEQMGWDRLQYHKLTRQDKNVLLIIRTTIFIIILLIIFGSIYFLSKFIH